jgi:hypothetical protein
LIHASNANTSMQQPTNQPARASRSAESAISQYSPLLPAR